MTQSQQLAQRLREVILDGKWIATTNVQEQISELPLTQAVISIKGLNSIAQLSFHINYYLAGVLQVLEGGELEIRDKYSFDLPPLNSEQDWQNLKQSLFDNAERFAQKVELLSAKQLDTLFVKEAYGDYRRNIEAIIEHSYYHLGQIVLINKLLTSK